MDLQEKYGLDLNDWLRGERNWLDLLDFINDLRQGSRYVSARLRDPDTIEALANLPEPEPAEAPMEGFTPLIARMANIEELLWRLLYAVLRADPSTAPKAARPVIPHMKRREEVQRSRLRSVVSKLLGGD